MNTLPEETIELLWMLREVARDCQSNNGELSEDYIVFDNDYDDLGDMLKATFRVLKDVEAGHYGNLTIKKDEDEMAIYYTQIQSVSRIKLSGEENDMDGVNIWGAYYDEFNGGFPEAELLEWACDNRPEMVRDLLGKNLLEKLKEILK